MYNHDLIILTANNHDLILINELIVSIWNKNPNIFEWFSDLEMVLIKLPLTLYVKK